MKPFFSLAILLSTAVALILPPNSKAVTLTLNGDDTPAATFNRPTETGALSFQNPRFNAYLFTIDLGGAYNFSLVAADPANFDTYLHLYQTNFDPADPAANFFRANDDAPGGADAGSALSNVALVAGTRYFLVADGFSALDYGAYTATISGPGNISAALVPEPSSIVPLALSAALGVWLMRRVRRQGQGAVTPR